MNKNEFDFSEEELAKMSDEEQLRLDIAHRLYGIDKGTFCYPYVSPKTGEYTLWNGCYRDIPNSDIEKIVSFINPQIDSYSNINNLEYGTRNIRIEDVQDVCGLYFDIDILHGKDIPDEIYARRPEFHNQIEQLIRRYIKEGKIVRPSKFIASGRGFALHYKYANPISTNDIERFQNHRKLVELIYSKLCMLLKDVDPNMDLDVDARVKNVNRVARLAGTKNTKVNKTARIIFMGPMYTFDELLHGFGFTEEELRNTVITPPPKSSTTRKKCKDDQVDGFKGRKNRKSKLEYSDYVPTECEGKICKPELDVAKFYRNCLEKLFKERKWVEGDKRANFIFLYYNTLKILFGADVAYEAARNKNDEMQTPITPYYFIAAIRSVDENEQPANYHWRGNGYFDITPKKVCSTAWLNVSEKEALKCGFLDNEIRKEKRAERKQVDRRRKETIADLYMSGYDAKQIHACLPVELKCSIDTVKRFICRIDEMRKRKSGDDFNLDLVLPYNRKGGIYNPCDLTDISKHVFKDERCRALLQRALNEEHNANKNEQDSVLEQLLHSTDNFVLTGKGGTGKTQLIASYISRLSEEERKRTLLLAPTGKAAENLSKKIVVMSGKTIHSCFKLKPGFFEPNELIKFDFWNEDVERIIIDEMGMIRIDLFEQLAAIIRKLEQRYKHRIQVILVGDYRQIAPVYSKKDQEVLDKFYPDCQGCYYAFKAPSWKSFHFKHIRLYYNHRIKTETNPKAMIFVRILEALAFGDLTVLDWINSNLSHDISRDNMYLCARVETVKRYNDEYIQTFHNRTVFKGIRLRNESAESSVDVSDDENKDIITRLELAPGMRIMTVLNSKEYKNGSIGIITKVTKNYIKVLFDGNKKEVKVTRKKFPQNDGSNISQLPVIVAHALTVHKAQGMTIDFDINIVPEFFGIGQLYTALTRCSDMKYIHIQGNFNKSHLHVSYEALCKLFDD